MAHVDSGGLQASIGKVIPTLTSKFATAMVLSVFKDSWGRKIPSQLTKKQHLGQMHDNIYIFNERLPSILHAKGQVMVYTYKYTVN